MNNINEKHVLTSPIEQYVQDCLRFKQEIQANPSDNAKYMAKTPFIRLSSNAVKWLTFEEKVELYKLFQTFENDTITQVVELINKDDNIYVNDENLNDTIFYESMLLTNIPKNKSQDYSIEDVHLHKDVLISDGYIKQNNLLVIPFNYKTGNFPIGTHFEIKSIQFHAKKNDQTSDKFNVNDGDVRKSLDDIYNGKIAYNKQSGNLGLITKNIKNKYNTYSKLTQKIGNIEYYIFKVNISIKSENNEKFIIYEFKNDKNKTDTKNIYFEHKPPIEKVNGTSGSSETTEAKSKQFTFLVPKKTIDDLIKNDSSNFFKLSPPNFDKLKLLTILYDVLVNDKIVTIDQLSSIYNIETEVIESMGGDIKKLLTIGTEYAKNHVLDSIDLSGKLFESQYDGGFHIFEKDGNIIKSEQTPNRDIKNGLGYRPKAGIVGMSVDTQGKVGVLRRVTINIKAFTKEQLEMVQSLYMRPGVFLFLEWGWSLNIEKIFEKIYTDSSYSIDSSGKNILNYIDVYTGKYYSKKYFNHKYKIVPNKSYIDFFGNENNKSISNEAILKQIDEKKKETNGHYDAIFGVVSNFNWSMTDSGEYDITVNLVSSTTTLLALQMSQNGRASLDSIFQVNVFNNFRGLFDVLSGKKGSNWNFSKLKSQLLKDKKFSNVGIDESSFTKFNVIEKITRPVAGGSDSKHSGSNDFINTLKKTKKFIRIERKIYFGDKEDKIKFYKNEAYDNDKFSIDKAHLSIDVGDNDNKHKTSLSLDKNSAKVKGSIVEYVWGPEKYFSIPEKTHHITFPLLTNKSINKNDFMNYMNYQGFDSIYSEFNNYIVSKFGSLSNLCSSGIKINGVEIKTPFIQQYKDWLDYKDTVDGKSNDNKKNAYNQVFKSNTSFGDKGKSGDFDDVLFNEKNMIKIHDFDNEMYKCIKKAYIIAYTDLVSTITENVWVSRKKYDELIKKFTNQKGVSTLNNYLNRTSGIVLYSDSILFNSKERFFGPVNSDYIPYKKEAYNKICSLEFANHIGGSLDSLKEWDNSTLYIVNTTHDKLLYKDTGDFKDTFKDAYMYDNNDSIGGGTVIVEEVTLEKKIEDAGGSKPYFINLKYLFYLLNHALLTKNTGSGPIKLAIGDNWVTHVDELIKSSNDISQLLRDKKKEIEDKLKKDNSINVKSKEYDKKLSDELKYFINVYNETFNNLKHSLFSGIDMFPSKDYELKTRKLEDFMSIKQNNVIFLTKKIVENTFKNVDIEIYDKLNKLAIDNIEKKDHNDFSRSIYVSCKFIHETIEKSQTLDSFVKSIFSEIFEASSNFIDLVMLDKHSTSNTTLQIADKLYNNVEENSSAASTGVFIFNTISNKSIIKNLTFGAKLPSSFQRVAFVASSPLAINSSGDSIVNKTLTAFSKGFVNNTDKFNFFGGGRSGAPEDSIKIKNEDTLGIIRKNPLDYSAIAENPDFPSYYSNYIQNKYIVETEGGEIDKLRKALKNNSGENVPHKFLIPPVGLELSFGIDGTSGLQWGNLISIDYLPNGLNGAVFQITKITDEIKDDGWTTNIGAILRSIDRK